MQDSDQERRQFTRFPFDGVVDFEYGENTFKAKLVDISLQGALIEMEQDWGQGKVDSIDFNLLLSEQALEIKFKGSIVHIADKLIGINCEHIDIDSASHLKRLIELNLGDSLLLARELSAMC